MTLRNSIPMSSPDLTDKERRAVANVLETPYLSMGQETRKFEAAIQKFTGAHHAISVNSGTAGLHLCVRAAGIKDGDLVITTPYSFVASSNVILYERAVPIFIDVDPQTGNIDVSKMEQVINEIKNKPSSLSKWKPRLGAEGLSNLSAILVVDVFGQPADMDTIKKIAHDYALQVIEDSCEALGAEYKGRKAGTLGDFGVFGFYPNKQITTGEGGVIITDNDQAAELMIALRNQGRAPGDTWLNHSYLGYNYRLNEMSAAVGRAQVERIDEILQKRATVAEWYSQRLNQIPEIETPVIVPSTTRTSWFVYVVRIQSGINRDKIAQNLQIRGIPSRPYFSPIHLQRFMINKFGYCTGDYPVCEDLGQRSLALPFSGVMDEHQVELVCNALLESIRAYPDNA